MNIARGTVLRVLLFAILFAGLLALFTWIVLNVQYFLGVQTSVAVQTDTRSYLERVAGSAQIVIAIAGAVGGTFALVAAWFARSAYLSQQEQVRLLGEQLADQRRQRQEDLKRVFLSEAPYVGVTIERTTLDNIQTDEHGLRQPTTANLRITVGNHHKVNPISASKWVSKNSIDRLEVRWPQGSRAIEAGSHLHLTLSFPVAPFSNLEPGERSDWEYLALEFTAASPPVVGVHHQRIKLAFRLGMNDSGVLDLLESGTSGVLISHPYRTGDEPEGPLQQPGPPV